MAASIFPSWDFSDHQGKVVTMYETSSTPTSQVRGSPQYRSPSPFPRLRLAEEVNTTEEQPEEPKGATCGDGLDEPSRPASCGSDASSMWGPPISYLDDVRQGHSPPRPASQDTEARREVKVITPPTSEEQPQSASIEQMPSAVVNDKTSLLADTNALEVDDSSECEDVTVHDTTSIMIQELNPYSSNEMPLINSTRPLRCLGVNQDDISFHSVSSHESNMKYLSACSWINMKSNDYLTPLETSAPKKGWLPVPRHRYSDYSGLGSSSTINSGEASLPRRGAVCGSRYRSGYGALTPSKSQPSPQSSSSLSAGQSLPNINAGFVGVEEYSRNPFVDHETKSSIPSPLTYSEIIAVAEAQPQYSLFPRQKNISQSTIMSIPIWRGSFEQLPPPAIPIECPVPPRVPRLSTIVVEVEEERKQDQPEPSDEKAKGWRSKSFFKRWAWLKVGKGGSSRQAFKARIYHQM